MLQSCLPAPNTASPVAASSRSAAVIGPNVPVKPQCLRSADVACLQRSRHDANGSPQWSGNAAAAVLAGLVVLSSATPALASVAVLEGPARIVDGDTLYIGQEKIRLYAVDAPEKTQACSNSKGQPYPCGIVSLKALKDHTGTKPIHCEVKTRDQYGRNVAACKIMAGRYSEDMGDWLVANGYAVAYRQYGKDYILAEEKAHAKHVGIWQGEFTEPALWRKQQKAGIAAAAAASSGSSLQAAPSLVYSSSETLAAAAPATAAGLSYAAAAAAAGAGQQAPVAADVSNSSSTDVSEKCSGALVKGNINKKGEKIYHTANSGTYTQVVIDESAGERYFCTEQEAEAAGWRAAQK